MKKKIVPALVLLLCILLAGCDLNVTGSVDTLMRPPKLKGESSVLQKTFEKTVGNSGSIIMKAPVSGDNRSSYLLTDIDKDGTEEALIFYSDPAVDEFAYVILLKQSEGKWVAVSTVKGYGDEIYEVEFADINGDKKNEIIISWTSLGGTGDLALSLGGNSKISTVYSYDGSSVTLIHTEAFTKMLVEDLDGDGSEELFFVTLDLSNNSERTIGKIISFNEDYSIFQKNSFVMSSFINIFNIVTDSTALEGENHTRIYVDGGISETGIITEIIDIVHDTLEITLPLYKQNTSDNPPTIRDVRVFSRDIDGDGIVEIPTSENLPGGVRITENSDVRSKLNLTVWSQLADGELTIECKSIINSTYSYMFIFPEEWIGKITAVYNVKSATLTFYELDSNLSLGSEMFSVKAFSELKWEEQNFGYSKFGENGAFVYGCMIEEGYKQQISRDFIANRFMSEK